MLYAVLYAVCFMMYAVCCMLYAVCNITGLQAVGLRIVPSAIISLSNIICKALVEYGLQAQTQQPGTVSIGDASSSTSMMSGGMWNMTFPEGAITVPKKLIMNISAKGKPKPPAWEESYLKFKMGNTLGMCPVLSLSDVRCSVIKSNIK